MRQRVRLVVCWLVLPVASTILVSFMKPIFSERFMAISAPALVLLAGKGLVGLEQIFPHRKLFPVSLALITGLSLWGIRRYDENPGAEGDSWRLVTEYVLARQQPGDAAFFYRASGSRVFTYYSRRSAEEHVISASPVAIFPADVTNTLLFNVDPSEEQVRHALGHYQRVWLILQHWEGMGVRESAMQTIQRALGRTYCLSQERDFQRGTSSIRVLLYVRCETRPNQ